MRPVPKLPLLPALILSLMAAGAPARALELVFPYPVLAVEALPPETGRHDLPVGPWDGETVPVRALEGVVDRRAYRLDAGGRTLTEVAAPLRDQLVAAGFEVLLDCEARACGGFDFRFRTEVLPEPGMHVDLAEFRFVAAARAGEAMGLLVSRSAGAAFVQVIRVAGTALPPPVEGAPPEASPPEAPASVAPPPAPSAADPAGLVARLDAGLPVALDDLVFASGAAALEAGDYASLAALAGWLRADPARRILLVGHTDASGGLEANIALAKRRAEAVRQVLMMRHDVPPAQVSAEGAGPLAPRATNATEEGRRKNRRVEAVPAPT